VGRLQDRETKKVLVDFVADMGNKHSCFISCSLSIFNPSQTFGLCDFGYPLLKKMDSAVEQQNNTSPIIFVIIEYVMFGCNVKLWFNICVLEKFSVFYIG
jgi:hypothetical protein